MGEQEGGELVPVYRVQLVRSGAVLPRRAFCVDPRHVYDVFRELIGDPDREHLLLDHSGDAE